MKTVDSQFTQISDTEGHAKFSNLTPQTYKLNASVKEYNFDANSNEITIMEGEHKKVTLIGKRQAFSVFGNAFTYSGRPLSAGTIIATRLDAETQEEAQIDKEGQFRIMNLQPGYTYRLVLDSPTVLRQIPKELEVTMPSYEEEADVFGVKVYVFERPTTIAIEGTINFEDPTMYDADSVKVELYLSSEVDKADAQPIKRSKFEPSAYFFFGSLPPNDYSLVIR